MAIRKITPRSILSGALTENLNIDSGTLYVDTSANRVGVATTSPTTALSVVGSANITSTSSNSFKVRNTVAGTSALSQISLGNDTDADLLYIQAFSTTYTTAGVAIQNGAVINGEGVGGLNLAATQAPIRFFSGGDTERMRLDSNGHLGLGVTPSATWSLSGGKALQLPSGSLLSYSTTDLHIAQNSFFNGTNWVYTNTGTATLQSQLSGEFQWNSVASGSAGSTSSFTRRMTLDASGKLGLGTSSPTIPLDIFRSTFTSTTPFANQLLRVGSFASGADASIVFSDSVVNNGYIGIQGGYLNFASNTLTPQLKLDSSGNLGLGVTPSAYDGVFKALDVGQAGNGISGNSGTTQITQGVYYNSGYKYSVTGTAVGRYEINIGVHKWNIAPSGTATNPITFTQAMTLGSNGFLGIGAGATSPAYPIDISTGANSAQIAFQSTISSGTNFKIAQGIQGVTNGGMQIYDLTNSAVRFCIQNGGNVGIGTTSPNALLEVYGGDIRLRSTSNGANGFLTFVNTGGTVASSIYNYNGLLSLNEQLIINNSTGNVGIGTTSPGSPLTVSTTGVNSTVQINSTDGAGGYGAVLSLNNTGTGGRQYNISSTSNSDGGVGGGKLKFYDVAAGTTRMLIDASGNVGIGTSSPTAKLDVSGTFRVYDASGNGILLYGAAGDGFGGNAAAVIFAGDPAGGGGWYFWKCLADYNGTPTTQAFMHSNGGLYNYSANNSNLSDIRVKKDITLAGSYLDKICAIPVKTFKYKNQTLPEDQEITLGVIAQDVEAVAPELVNVTGFGDTPEDGIPLKSIYQTDLQYALMKCIQEQQALIEALTLRLNNAGL